MVKEEDGVGVQKTEPQKNARGWWEVATSAAQCSAWKAQTPQCAHAPRTPQISLEHRLATPLVVGPECWRGGALPFVRVRAPHIRKLPGAVVLVITTATACRVDRGAAATTARSTPCFQHSCMYNTWSGSCGVQIRQRRGPRVQGRAGGGHLQKTRGAVGSANSGEN